MAWIYGRSLDGIVGSKPAGGMGACLLRGFCIVRYEVSATADYSSRGVLPSVVISVIAKPRQACGLSRLEGKIPERMSVCSWLLI